MAVCQNSQIFFGLFSFPKNTYKNNQQEHLKLSKRKINIYKLHFRNVRFLFEKIENEPIRISKTYKLVLQNPLYKFQRIFRNFSSS